MSLVFNMVGGGAGGSAELPAIYVTYPEGSVCTCSNGVKTFTAKDTTGFWLFAGLEVGMWTVRITDPSGENAPESQTVEITSEGQIVNVELSYVLWLYKDGNEYNAITGGWKIVNDVGGDGNLEPTYILVSASKSGVRNCSAYTKNRINTIGRSKLVAEVEITTLDTNYSTYTFWLGLSDTNSAPAESNFIAHAAINELGKKTVELDLTGTQGEYFVKLYAGAGGVAKVTIVNIE